MKNGFAIGTEHVDEIYYALYNYNFGCDAICQRQVTISDREDHGKTS